MIPYLAVYLRDIIYTKDGNPRHLKEAVEGEEPTINFQRLRLLYQQMKKVISRVQISTTGRTLIISFVTNCK